ncbi:Lachesin like protein [Argiope bruennichi]|uniref:Lachesin like protein n=1 Tax=Argiope bruennichi TaxID=94029 RepID=A0A8T0FRD5_ARGBR|nr:Lachesin like protein [Argiope bruennichi]
MFGTVFLAVSFVSKRFWLLFFFQNESVNASKTVCRDETQVYNGTEEEICPQFAQAIGNITQAVGREARLECVVDNLGRFRVAWMRIETKTILTMHRHVISRNYRIALSHSEHRVYVLHINDVQEEDRGSYMCQVNTVPMLWQVGYLDVVVPPDIIEEQSSSDMFAREGTDVQLKCAAKGRPEPKLTWRREDYKPVGILIAVFKDSFHNEVIRMADDPPQDTSAANASIHEGAVLEIKKVSRLHMGAYLCIASNGVPPAVSRRITLQVNFPPMIWIPNQLVGAPLGGNVTLECNTEAYPESMNYWSRHNNEMISDGGRFDVIFTVSTYKINMILTIHQLIHTDYGIYHCLARNSLGNTEGTIRLYEIHVPQSIKEPSSAKIHSLNGVSATGDTDPDYEKDQTGKSDEKSPETSITFTEKEDFVNSGSLIRAMVQEVMVSVSIAILTTYVLLRPGT